MLSEAKRLISGLLRSIKEVGAAFLARIRCRSEQRPTSAERARADRIRALSRRCRDLSEMTAVPEITRELVSIADELENESELVMAK